MALAGALLLLAPARYWGQVPVVTAAKVSAAGGLRPPRQTMRSVEMMFDTRLGSLGSANDPVDMLGLTRGVYLSDYGAIFSSEISLTILLTPNPFRPPITKKQIEEVHQKKLGRLPALREGMRAMLRDAANNLPQVPDTHRFVVAVQLDYMNWEDRKDLPAQITMSADRKGALSGAVQVTEEP